LILSPFFRGEKVEVRSYGGIDSTTLNSGASR